jgi:hypothetical protein
MQLNPFVIMKGKAHYHAYYNTAAVSAVGDWTFAISPNGWIGSELALERLKAFTWVTRPRKDLDEEAPAQPWRMLIMDGHETHLTLPFVEYALDREVLIFILPPHPTHYLQPLDLATSQRNS